MRRLCHLPEEVLEEILLRLPPKSLTRFKCVCKSWYALIKDRSFVDKHVHFNKNGASPSTSLLLIWIRNVAKGTIYEQVLSLVTINNDDSAKGNNDQIPCVVEDLNLSMVPNIENMALLRGSQCNGIIWLSEYLLNRCGQTVLYNPTIKEFKLLPRPCLFPLFLIAGEGLGYDSKASDYKFIRILVSRKNMEYEYMAEMYTVGSDSWRPIKIDINLYGGSINQATYCKGACYWWATRLRGNDDFILSFDMSSDEFCTIPLPYNMKYENGSLNSLTVWNESIAVLFSPIEAGLSFSFEIWAMDDTVGGVEGPWTRYIAVGPLAGIESPITFWKDDELLMITRNSSLVSYNLGTKKLRNVQIHGLSTKLSACFAYLYRETLVSVNGRK